jgi:hypothetical protein
MSSKDDLSRDEIDVLRQIADGGALIRLSVYLSRPYVDFLKNSSPSVESVRKRWSRLPGRWA